MAVPSTSLAFVPRSVLLRRQPKSSAPTSALRTPAPLQSRLHSELEPLVESFLEFCNQGAPIAFVEPRPVASVFNPPVAWYYEMLRNCGVEFYIICGDYSSEGLGTVPTTQTRFTADTKVEEVLRKGALTHCKCMDAMYCLWPALGEMYKEDPEVKKVEWVRQGVMPRKVFFNDYTIGNEKIFYHDFFIIHAKNGRRYVFDPTSYQFGIPGFLFEYLTYRTEYLYDTHSHETIDPNHIFMRFGYEACCSKDTYRCALRELQKRLLENAKSCK